MKKIKDVKVLSECIACGTCVVACPKVFEVDSISQVRKDCVIKDHQDCIEEAAAMCPVDAIEIEWDKE